MFNKDKYREKNSLLKSQRIKKQLRQKMSFLFLSVIFSLGITACGSGSGSGSNSNIVCPSVNFDPSNRNDNIIASLGFGYDQGRDLHKPQSCLKGNNGQVGGETAKIDFSLINGYEQFKRDLNLSAGLDVNAKLFKLNARSEFAMNHQETKLSKSMFLKSEIFSHQQFNQQGLSEFGERMLNDGRQCFLSACGNSFIYQSNIGGRLLVAMKFDFNSEKSKKTFFSELGASYKAVSIKAAIKKVKESVIKGSSITITAEQIGGDASNLGRVFGEGSPVISCSLNTIKESAKGESCIEESMKNALEYAKNEFAPNIGSKPHTLSFTTIGYTSAGIPVSLEDVPMNIISARNELAAKYQSQYGDWITAKDWLKDDFREYMSCTGNAVTSQQSCIDYLSTIKSKIQANLSILRNAGLWCFSDLSKCLAKKQEAYDSLQTYDRTWLYRIKAVEHITPPVVEFKEKHTSVLLETSKTARGCRDASQNQCMSKKCKAIKATINTIEHTTSSKGGPYGPTISKTTDNEEEVCYRVDVRICTRGGKKRMKLYKGTFSTRAQCPIVAAEEKREIELVFPAIP